LFLNERNFRRSVVATGLFGFQSLLAAQLSSVAALTPLTLATMRR
jgi:hypothetical protein